MSQNVTVHILMTTSVEDGEFKPGCWVRGNRAVGGMTGLDGSVTVNDGVTFTVAWDFGGETTFNLVEVRKSHADALECETAWLRNAIHYGKP